MAESYRDWTICRIWKEYTGSIPTEESKLTLVLKMINRIPNHTYPLGGWDGYYNHLEKYGESSKLILIWRSLWHALGGAIVATPLLLVLPWWGPVLSVAVFSSLKELYENEGSVKKRLVDVGAWTIGALMGVMYWL